MTLPLSQSRYNFGVNKVRLTLFEVETMMWWTTCYFQNQKSFSKLCFISSKGFLENSIIPQLDFMSKIIYFTAVLGWAFNSFSCHICCKGWLHCLAKCQSLPGRNDCVAKQNVRCCQVGLIALLGKMHRVSLKLTFISFGGQCCMNSSHLWMR